MQQSIKLPNGLRIVFEQYKSDVVYMGYVVCTGTRNEDSADSGMAHFIEHMTFKGTARRRAYHVSNYLERVGGDLNAFTNKQETVYHATVLKKDFSRAADLLTDIVFHSTYPQHEMEKEVEVICDEIDSFLDNPSELIFDDFEALLFPNHPLGRDILGEKNRLRSYTTADAQRFTQKFYRPENAVFFVYGNLSFDRIVRTLEKLFAAYPVQREQLRPAPKVAGGAVLPKCAGEVVERQRQLHQAHVIMGTRVFGGDDERRFALMLINNILGGPAMNSRFCANLRDRLGLVYTIDSFLYLYPDVGVWEVYFGCDMKDISRCRRQVEKELGIISERLLTPTQLRTAKQQLIGQVGIARDNHESHALALGKTFAHYDSLYDPQYICQRIEALTAEDVRQTAAQMLSPENMLTLIYK